LRRLAYLAHQDVAQERLVNGMFGKFEGILQKL